MVYLWHQYWINIHGCSVDTHQIGAHGALRQHESTFRHQEDLNVGETWGLLVVVILLRVVGAAAPLGADLLFDLHPSTQAPVGMKLNGSGPAETIRLWREAALQNRCHTLSVARLGWKIPTETLLSTQHYAQPVSDLITACPQTALWATSYLNAYKCMTLFPHSRKVSSHL